MRVELITDIKAIDPKQWDALNLLSQTRTIFQTYAFNTLALQIYGHADTPFIISVWDNTNLKALMPLILRKTKKGRVLEFIAHERSDYADILFDKDTDGIHDLIWGYIFERRSDWDYLHLINVPIQSKLCEYLKNNNLLKSVTHRCSQDEAPYVFLNEDKDYTQSLLNKKRVNTYRHYLQKHGQYQVLHLTDRDVIQGYLDTFFKQHIDRWANTSSLSLFLKEENINFFKGLINQLPQSSIVFTVLRWNEEVLAFHYGLTYEKTFMWYKPSYNKAFAQYSPGQVLLLELLEYTLAQGFNEFDFGVGKDNFKYRFANKLRLNNSFKIFSSRKVFLLYYLPIAIQWRWEQLLKRL